MRHWALLVLPLLAACGAGAGGTYVLSDATESIGVGGLPIPPLAQQETHTGFALLLNAERDGARVTRVTEDSRLTAAARAHAQDMVDKNYLSHVAQNGTTVGDRALAVGYDWNFIAENIARGYRTNAEVVDAWMKSPSHAVNMVDPRAEDFGLGRVNNTWVLMLGREFK